MDTATFNHAREMYQADDYQGALNEFSKCLSLTPLDPGEVGLVYHQIGNCLVKMKNSEAAIQAYVQSAADSAYEAVGAVNYNLGMAYASLHDYGNAVRCFQLAVEDPRYDSPYKAYLSMGNALMKIGRCAEAGVAFREAALDERNADPTKALLNLGVCFMALNRPADAISSYESALQFDLSAETRNKLYANMGQAFVACGDMQQAVNAFEQAIADRTYYLSDSASVDYQRAVTALAQAASMQPNPNVDTSGLDAVNESAGLAFAAGASTVNDSYYYYDNYNPNDNYADSADRFLNASDEEIEQFSKGAAKQDRKRKNVGLKLLIAFFIVLLLAFGGAVFLYTQGYGYPQQTAVIETLFNQGTSADVFAKDVSQAKIDSISDLMVIDSSATISGMNQSMSESDAYVVAHTPEGGEVQYHVSLVRDGIGWKVSNVEMYFSSMN